MLLLLQLIYNFLERYGLSFSCGFSCACFSSFKGREIGNEKMIGVLDLHKISYKNVDARGLITGFQFIQVYLSCSIYNSSAWKYIRGICGWSEAQWASKENDQCYTALT